MYLIGTDIGTQGTKTVIVDEKGKIKSESFREYDVLTPRPSWAHQWPDVWFRAVCGSIKEAIEKSVIKTNEIAGIAVSGLYGGSGIAVDKESLQKGDLIFFAHDQGKGSVHHVAMYIGDGNMIHSPRAERSVEIIPLNTPGYIEEYAGARRYLP